MDNESALVTTPSSDSETDPPIKKLTWGGLTLCIEVENGNNREMGDYGYVMNMSADYGYVEGTVSMEEGDALDIFMNPESEVTSGKVYTIGMLADTGVLEEEKVFLNFDSSKDAKECFLKHYDPAKFGYIYVMRDEDFIAMAKSRVQEATLKNRELDEKDSEQETAVVDEPVLIVNVNENHELLFPNEEKSLKREPLFTLVKGMDSHQRMALIRARKETRNAC